MVCYNTCRHEFVCNNTRWSVILRVDTSLAVKTCSLYSYMSQHKCDCKNRLRSIPIWADTKEPKDYSIKNATELKLIDRTIEENDILISFDIESYFPSVPITESIDIIESWLDSQLSSNHMVRGAYNDLLNFCLKQAYLKSRGKFFYQSTDTAMGNPFSPFVCKTYVGEENQHKSVVS